MSTVQSILLYNVFRSVICFFLLARASFDPLCLSDIWRYDHKKSLERVFLCVFKQATWLRFRTLWNYQSVRLSDREVVFVFYRPSHRGGRAREFSWDTKPCVVCYMIHYYCTGKLSIYCIYKYLKRLKKFIQTKMRRQLFEKVRKTSLYCVQPILKLNREGRGRHSALWIGGPQSSLSWVINLGPTTLARFASPYSPPHLLSHFRRGRKGVVPSSPPPPPRVWGWWANSWMIWFPSTIFHINPAT